MKPKEDPADKAARLRERRMSELEQGRAAEKNSASLTSDLRAVYNFGNAPGMSFRPMAPSVFGSGGKGLWIK